MTIQPTPAQQAAMLATVNKYGAEHPDRPTMERKTKDLLFHVYPPGATSALLFRVSPAGKVSGV